MKRFLVLAFVGAWSLAGSTGLVFGQNVGPQAPSKPQAKKVSPTTAPGKRPPSTSQPPAKKRVPQTSKSPNHRGVKVDVPKGGQRPTAPKPPAKPGKGTKPGSGSYTLDNYKRDMNMGVQEQRDGTLEELPVDAAMVAAAASGGTGLVGVAATGYAAGGQQWLHGKYLQAKGEWDMTAATGKLIGSWFSDIAKENPRPKNYPFGAGK